MTKVYKPRKLTAELFLIMAVSAAVSLSTMTFLYSIRFTVFEWALNHNLVEDGREDYIRWVSQEAPKYMLEPVEGADEADREMIDLEYLPFLFEHRDKYTGFNIYNEDGYYVTGYLPEGYEEGFWESFFWKDINTITGQWEYVESIVMFKDGLATLVVSSFRVLKIFPVYLGGSLVFCIAVFLTPVLIFVHRRMAYLGKIRSEIMAMAEGDLQHPVTIKGRDELSSLAEELDYLRQALSENIEKERQAHLSNQELIRAMSHDLRTPLTTLYGYLEILDHTKGNPEKYPEYVRRCLSKTEEIRTMSDKMFEYALVFEGQAHVEMQDLSLEILWDELSVQTDYLHTQGFKINWGHREQPVKEVSKLYFKGNAFLIKRLIGNLVSNIQRYGLVSEPVEIITFTDGEKAEISMKNTIRPDPENTGSGVGLKSASGIAAIHGGTLHWEEKNGIFQVFFAVPVKH